MHGFSYNSKLIWGRRHLISDFVIANYCNAIKFTNDVHKCRGQALVLKMSRLLTISIQ